MSTAPLLSVQDLKVDFDGARKRLSAARPWC